MTCLLLRWTPGRGHYRLELFAGADGDHLAHCGRLTLRPYEAADLRAYLLHGAPGGRVEEQGWIEPHVLEESTT